MITDDSFNKDDIVDGVQNRAAGMEWGTDATAVWAVDATLAYVVDWLRSTGHSAKADILESLSELGD